MKNTLDLDPEWGAIDLIEDVEQVFDLKITDTEAERCETIGGLYSLICDRVPDWEQRRGKCSTAMTFYRIRQVLDSQRDLEICPQTPLLDDRPHDLFKRIEQGTGLRLPATTLTMIGSIGAVLLASAIIGTIVLLMTGNWLVASVGVAIGTAGVVLLRIDSGRLPTGIATMDDLVRRTAALNDVLLREKGGRPGDRWAILTALAAEHGALAPSEIRPDTYLHRKSLKLAEGT